MKALAAVVLTLCASSVLAAPIVTNNAGYGGSTIGVFGSPAGATFPNTHHGQSFVASDTAYHSIGVDIDEVYGLGTRGFFDPGANFDMRFQVFAGVGTGGALLRTIDYDPGLGHDGWLDFEVTGIAFTNGGSYTATFSAADESGEHLWFGFLSSMSVYAWRPGHRGRGICGQSGPRLSGAGRADDRWGSSPPFLRPPGWACWCLASPDLRGRAEQDES